jgi:hypothetical protein
VAHAGPGPFADRKDIMTGRFPTALTLSVVLAAGLRTAACGNGSAQDADAAATGPSAGASEAQDSATGGTDKAGSGGTGAGDASGTDEDTSDDTAADEPGYGQGCGTNDLDWSAGAETRAGGYILLSVKARSGITCFLPGGHQAVALGSGGVQAGPVEQSAGEEITLGGGRTVYAGVSPKTTAGDAGTEFGTVIVSVSEQDPHPLSLDIDRALVEEPVTTNRHTNPADAVPPTS